LIAELLNIKDIEGHLKFSGKLSGLLNKPQLVADFTGFKIKYQNFPIDSVKGQLIFENDNLFFPHLYCSGSLSKIDSLKPPFQVSEFQGGFRYFGSASGPLENLQADVSIELLSPKYQSLVFDKGFLTASLQNHMIQLKKFNLIRDSLLTNIQANFSMTSLTGNTKINFFSVNAAEKNELDFNNEAIENNDNFFKRGKILSQFDFSNDSDMNISVSGEEVHLMNIVRLLSDSLNMTGTLNFNSEINGTFVEPKLYLKLFVTKPAFKFATFDSIISEIQFDRSLLAVKYLDLFVNNFHSHIDATLSVKKDRQGSYLIAADNETQGKIVGDYFDLSLLNSLFPENKQIEGIGEFDIVWAGTINFPHLKGRIGINEGLFKDISNQLMLEKIQANIVLQDTIFQIREIQTVVQKIPLKLIGTIKAEQWENFLIELKLVTSNEILVITDGLISQDSVWVEANIKDLNLALIQPFLGELNQISGILNSEILINGQPLNPEINGRLEIREFQAHVPFVNSKLNQGMVKINFDKRNVIVDSLSANLNGGTIYLTGNLSHDDGKLNNLNLKTKIEKIKINRPKELVLNIKSSEMSYKKKEQYYVLDGDIILGETKFIYNLRPQEFLNFARSVERPKPEQAELLKNTKFNVRLRESENIWIDNNLAYVRLHPELSLIGTPANPYLGGRLTIEDGYVLYLDRKFKILKGIIDFIDPNRMNPIINIEAKATLKSYQTLVNTQYEITLTINGSLDQTEIILISDPVLDKADIISLLTIGATRQQLTSSSVDGKEPTTKQILLERAKSLSSERISGFAERKLGNALGLEKITIEGNLFKFGNSWGPQLLASKKLSSRVGLVYTTTVGHMNEQNIRLEYLLSKKFSIEGQTDQQGRSGIDLKYKLKFK